MLHTGTLKPFWGSLSPTPSVPSGLFLVKVANLPESKREIFLELIYLLWKTDSDTELESVIDSIFNHVNKPNGI